MSAASGTTHHVPGIAVVTGAGSGVGSAVAHLLARDGFQVVVVGRTHDKLTRVASSLAEVARRPPVVVDADVSDVAGLPVMVARIHEHAGPVDVVVNCAGIFGVSAFKDVTPEQFREFTAVNVAGPLFVTQALLDDLRMSSRASVVNVSSVAASALREGTLLYGMTKAAIEYQTRSLAVELARDGIRVNAVALGPIDTGIHDGWLAPGPERVERLAAGVPLGRPGTAEEVAWWIARLCGDRAGWMTGAVIPVDGGKVLGERGSYL